MALTQKNIKLAFLIYWLLLMYITASLVWWLIILSKQNADMAALKINDLPITDIFYSTKYEAIIKQKNINFLQYIAEGSFFLLFILLGASFLRRAFKKEMVSTAKQRNFMMAITHELKTPIAISKLNLETIQKHKLTAIQQEKLLSNTLQETNRLDTLCNNLLLSTQIDESGYEASMEILDFSTLINNCANEFVNRYTQRVIKVDIHENIFVNGDKFLLQMAASNLIENAIKYSPKDKPIEILLHGLTDFTILKIIDEGQGISDIEKESVFNKYYRIGNLATKTSKGTGLGLYLVKRICLTHKAKIIIENNPKAGSIFTLTFKTVDKKNE
jgi:two-component system, OmpR family, sensor histidine kinase CiaH